MAPARTVFLDYSGSGIGSPDEAISLARQAIEHCSPFRKVRLPEFIADRTGRSVLTIVFYQPIPNWSGAIEAFEAAGFRIVGGNKGSG